MDCKDRTRQIRVMPGRPGAIALVIAGAVFLVFGTVLTGAGLSDSDDPTLTALLYLFRVIWWAGCLGMIVFGTLALVKRKPPVMLEVDISSGEGKGDFETRLRKLEDLRRDGLISEKEYRQKREEVVTQKW